MGTHRLIAERYELGPCIGQGGMGTVLRAVDTLTGQAVAIKRLTSGTARSDPAGVERFRREGEALRKLNHPSIVKVLAMVEEGEQHYLVMELVGRGSLESLLRETSQPLDIDRALNIALDLSDALARAHRLGIVHRDIKPSNVLIAEDGTPRLTDFGVAYIAGKERLSVSNGVIGTLDYLCPEALSGSDVDARSDIWAFGVVLFEMLAGRRPFTGEHAAATIHAILTASPPDLEALRADCPIALVDLTYRMLEKDRSQRIPSARRVGAEIESISEARGFPESAPRRRRGVPFEDEGAAPSEDIQPARGLVGGALSGSRTVAAAANEVEDPLPVHPTPFVGREEELAQLAELLDDPVVRLVTIVGPGGMGKSRLAVEAGRLLAEGRGAFQATAARGRPGQRRVAWVELAPLAQTEFIASAIAESVGFKFYPGSEPRAQLLAHLRDKRLLLVLDNFEHLLEGASFVNDMLQAAPRVKVLATSRERLGLSVETAFPLSGMSYPASATFDCAAEFSAVKLFVQAARRAKLDFDLAQDATREAAHICRLLEGMPLAIVLAASWANVLTLQDIALEIREGFDFLQGKLRDLPERQQSIRSVFDRSWDLLGADERAVFARLSVFRGGFTRDAAQAVAGASLRTLASLMNKSLITRHPESGRYEVHELLRQYAASQLGATPDDRERTLDRHGSYYAAYLGAREAGLKSAEPQIVAREIESELDNVRAGWRQLLASKRFDQVGLAIDGLNLFYELRALLVEAESVFRATVEVLEPVENEPASDASRWLGRALSLLAGYTGLQGRFVEANDLVSRALVLLDEQSSASARADALLRSAWYSVKTANIQDRIATAERALVLYRTTNDAWGMARALFAVADLCFHWLGDVAKAEAYYRECIALQESTGAGLIFIEDSLTALGFVQAQRGNYAEGLALMQRGLAMIESRGLLLNKVICLCQLADIERNLGDYARAEHHARSSLSLSRQIAFWEMEVWSNLELGLVLQEQGHLDEASRNYREAHAQCVGDSAKLGLVLRAPVVAQAKLHMGDLAMLRGAYGEAKDYLMGSFNDYERIGTRQGIGLASNSLGHLACHENEHDTAHLHFRRALEIGDNAGIYPLALNAIAGLGRVFAETSRPKRAIEFLSLAKNHPAIPHGTRTKLIDPLLAELRTNSSTDDFAAAFERGRRFALDGAMSDWLTSSDIG